MTLSHIEKIKALFIKLKCGYDWCQRHQDEPKRIQELFKRSESIFIELEKLDVSRTFSEALFVFGPLITDELVNQFKGETDTVCDSTRIDRENKSI